MATIFYPMESNFCNQLPHIHLALNKQSEMGSKKALNFVKVTLLCAIMLNSVLKALKCAF
jgi:hypothetical protein